MRIRIPGFSLTEVLIALVLLGIVAAFAVPKMLQGVENQRRGALMQETIGALSSVLAEGTGKGEVSRENLYSYFVSRMNVAKSCPNSSIDDNCWDPDAAGASSDSQFSEPGFILPSGVIVSGFSACCGPGDTGHEGSFAGEYKNGILIDWNGMKAPNVVGEDQLVMNLCFGSKPCRYNSSLPICTDTVHPSNNPQPAGTLMVPNNKAGCDSNAAYFIKNATLYQTLLK